MESNKGFFRGSNGQGWGIGFYNSKTQGSLRTYSYLNDVSVFFREILVFTTYAEQVFLISG